MQVGKPITQSLSSVLDFFFFFFPSVAVLGSAFSETSRFFFFFLGVPFSSASPLACAALFSCSCGSSSLLSFISHIGRLVQMLQPSRHLHNAQFINDSNM
uniref:Uncharacterized protein n=1 Tax=Oryza barthii TaxID=65489 RepID=A0A0D3FIH8_9ORYZ